MISEDRLRALDALYAAATEGHRKVVDLNADDPPETMTLWAVTNDALAARHEWLAEIRYGTKADADFDAALYNAWPDLLDHIRHLHAFETLIRVTTAAVEDRIITLDMFYQRIVTATQYIQRAETLSKGDDLNDG